MSMSMSKRLYLAAGLVALVAIAFSAVTLTSRFTSAADPTVVPQACNQADDAAEAAVEGADTDAVEAECGPQDAADGSEAAATGADTVVPCSDPTGANDAAEAKDAPDTDSIEEQCGP